MLDVHSTEPSFNSDSSREARRERQVRDVALIPPPPSRLVQVPLAFTGGIVALAASPAVRSNRHVLIALLGAAFALCAWNVLLLVLARRRGRTLTLEVVPRTQHYIQACAQGSVL